MKNNKGFAPIVIVLIILGVIAIGGASYYAGKNMGLKNDVPDITADIQTVEENNINTTPTTQNTNSECTANSSPNITIISPIGGEAYIVGQKITVKWKSCNIPTTHKVDIGLMPVGEFQGVPPMIILSRGTANDGTETYTLSNFGVSADKYTVFMKDDDLPNGTTNTWSGQITISSSNLSTVLPDYIGGQSEWPPVVTHSSTPYSCIEGRIGMGVPTSTTEKVLNGKKYCIQINDEGAAGTIYYTYNYTTASPNGGTEVTHFTLAYHDVMCEIYGDATNIKCHAGQPSFNVDSIISSLM